MIKTLKIDESAQAEDEITTLFTNKLSYCTGIAIVTEHQDRLHRFLAHIEPGYTHPHVPVHARNFLLKPNLIVKKAQLASSMGYMGLEAKHLTKTEYNILTYLKAFFREVNLEKDFTFNFQRASSILVTPQGEIAVATPEETLAHILATYKTNSHHLKRAYDAIKNFPSLQIM